MSDDVVVKIQPYGTMSEEDAKRNVERADKDLARARELWENAVRISDRYQLANDAFEYDDEEAAEKIPDWMSIVWDDLCTVGVRTDVLQAIRVRVSDAREIKIAAEDSARRATRHALNVTQAVEVRLSEIQKVADSFENIYHVELDESGELRLYFTDVRMRPSVNPYEFIDNDSLQKYGVRLADICVRVPLGGDKLWVAYADELDRKKGPITPWDRQVHPHVLSHNSPCLGDFSDMILQAVGRAEIDMLITGILMFLRQAYDRDAAGRHWPMYLGDVVKKSHDGFRINGDNYKIERHPCGIIKNTRRAIVVTPEGRGEIVEGTAEYRKENGRRVSEQRYERGVAEWERLNAKKFTVDEILGLTPGTVPVDEMTDDELIAELIQPPTEDRNHLYWRGSRIPVRLAPRGEPQQIIVEDGSGAPVADLEEQRRRAEDRVQETLGTRATQTEGGTRVVLTDYPNLENPYNGIAYPIISIQVQQANGAWRSWNVLVRVDHVGRPRTIVNAVGRPTVLWVGSSDPRGPRSGVVMLNGNIIGAEGPPPGAVGALWMEWENLGPDERSRIIEQAIRAEG